MDSNELFDKAQRLLKLREAALAKGDSGLAAQAEEHLRAIRVQISSPGNFGVDAPKAPAEPTPEPAQLSPFPGEPKQPVSRDSFLAKPGGITLAGLTMMPNTGGGFLKRALVDGGSTAAISDLNRMDQEGYSPDLRTLGAGILGAAGGYALNGLPRYAPGTPAGQFSGGVAGAKEMIDAGVPMTTGQAVDKNQWLGKALNNLEEATGSALGGAGVLNARKKAQDEGFKVLAQKVSNQAPDGVPGFGPAKTNDPMEYLGQINDNFHKGYGAALDYRVKPDGTPATITVPDFQLRKWREDQGVDKLPDLSPERAIYDAKPNPQFKGYSDLPYPGMKKFQRNYRDAADKFGDKRNMESYNADWESVNRRKANEVLEPLRIQDPAGYDVLKSIDSWRANTQPLIEALEKGKGQWPTPAQVSTAVGKDMPRFKEAPFLRGMTENLNDKVRNSGTSDRWHALQLLQVAASGAGGAGGAYTGGAEGATAGALLPLALPALVGGALSSQMGRRLGLGTSDLLQKQLTPARFAAILQQMDQEQQ
jgi:hypothetical protein